MIRASTIIIFFCRISLWVSERVIAGMFFCRAVISSAEAKAKTGIAAGRSALTAKAVIADII
jgi:hypothetical protein